MKMLSRRSAIIVLIVFLLLSGISFFAYRLVTEGSDWAAFVSNSYVFSSGRLKSGTVYDRDGKFLMAASEVGYVYNNDVSVRCGTVFAVGDRDGYIATGALKLLTSKLIGYNIVTGVSGNGRVKLSVSSAVSAAAYDALSGRSGTVGVYNYKTGEILCMVSSPAPDPCSENASTADGAYLNRLLSGLYVPGSVFKLVTAAAAIENISDISEREFTCTGSLTLDGERIVCSGVHGSLDFNSALANSCNCVFAELASELGAETLSRCAERLGLTSRLNIDGFFTAAGRLEISSDSAAELGWSGVGQANDMVNPCAMMVLCGAIANDGYAAVPELEYGKAAENVTLLNADTAHTLQRMMRYNVSSKYGEESFPGLSIGAKSGTAEVGGENPHSWFVGFLDDASHPYAFVVVIEHGGSGVREAGAVANTVLQKAVEADSDK